MRIMITYVPRLAALSLADHARSYTRTGDTRFGALFAREGLRANDDLLEAENALADALARPIETNRMLGHEAAVNSVTFSPDGTRILSGSEDKKVRLWNAHTGEPIEPLLDTVERVAFSPDGTRIVSRSKDNQVSFSPPDSTRIVSASADKTLGLWDASTGKQIRKPMVGHTAAILAVAYSRDGERIVSASRDRTLRLWDGRTGDQIGMPLIGHTEEVEGAVFSPDGSRIASASADKTLRLWDVDTGLQIGEPLRG